jgi:iron complex transport system substrate-binding protein
MQSIRIVLYGLFIGLLSILPFTGCNQDRQTRHERFLHGSEERLIVTNPDALEVLFGLGASKSIVGISDTPKSFIEKSNNWAVIGNWRTPNIEAIVNMNPNIIVAYKKWPDPASFDDKLRNFKISVERMDCFRISEYHSDIYRLASLVGKEKEADMMINDFDKIIDIIENAVTDIGIQVRVYFEFTDFTAMGPETGGDEILKIVNAKNIASHLKVPYPKISTEWLLEENPDVIIKSITVDSVTVDMYEALLSRPGWDKLDAVKNRRVYLISSELCSSPRAMIGSLYVGKWCYPEKFALVNPDSVHSCWLKKYCGNASGNKYILHPKSDLI